MNIIILSFVDIFNSKDRLNIGYFILLIPLLIIQTLIILIIINYVVSYNILVQKFIVAKNCLIWIALAFAIIIELAGDFTDFTFIILTLVASSTLILLVS